MAYHLSPISDKPRYGHHNTTILQTNTTDISFLLFFLCGFRVFAREEFLRKAAKNAKKGAGADAEIACLLCIQTYRAFSSVFAGAAK
jgi:hypothetical protein